MTKLSLKLYLHSSGGYHNVKHYHYLSSDTFSTTTNIQLTTSDWLAGLRARSRGHVTKSGGTSANVIAYTSAD